ncbi:MAG: Lipopolysaccharide export system protein LptA [Candidatus Scalindua arabica]|uniref:Lipopolysaccharide export system protein LptA n=1 Tax=Candidatus Scalindua arabica TaxID=1127984 RepID=A0A941W3G9_9BACT|nr:Lipopolysaccharide export system protein LptA [Candidatus Scalindua arabica]
MLDLARKKRRYVYLGIIFICFSLLALSVSGLFRFTTYVKKEEKPILKEIIDEDSKKKQQQTQVPGTNDITQEIYGLYLPSYDDNGKEVSVIRGAYTIFFDNKIYKITNPEVEFAGDGDKDGNDKQSKGVVITSDFGEMDKTNNKGFLYDNVITRFGEDLEIYTEDLTYSPEDNKVNTDGPVTVKGGRMKVTGTGFEVSLSDARAVIKNDPDMEIISNEDEVFIFSDEGSPANKNIAENIFIRASGELVFEHKKKLATFYDNVRTSKGKATIFSDKLSIPFDSELESMEQVIASGNVLASDGEKNAKGETLTWDTEKEIAILEDDPVAEYSEDKLSITAPKIIFSKVHGKMDVPVAGQLTTTMNLKSKKQEEKDANKKTETTETTIASSDKTTSYDDVTISWKGKMSFAQDTNLAIFEDDVVATKEDTTLYCEWLEMRFDNENNLLEEMEATKLVHMIEKRGDTYREAKGDKLIWTSSKDYTELYGNNPLASVKDNKKQVFAPKITFIESEEKMLAEGKGYLLSKSKSKKKNKESKKKYKKSKKEATGFLGFNQQEKLFIEEELIRKSNLFAMKESPTKTSLLRINWTKEMIYNGSSNVANFYEMIKVTKEKEKLNCDRLDVFFDDQDQARTATAFGNVYFLSPDSDNTEGLGTLLEWDLIKDKAVLTGNPLAELRRSDNRTFSKKIYFDISTNRVHWKGRPHWKVYHTGKYSGQENQDTKDDK